MDISCACADPGTSQLFYNKTNSVALIENGRASGSKQWTKNKCHTDGVRDIYQIHKKNAVHSKWRIEQSNILTIYYYS